MSNSGIYKITNIENNKIYIGSSTDINHRIQTHFRRLKNKTHPNKHLQSSYLKYGIENFKWEILELCDRRELLSREQKYLDKLDYNKSYNQASIAGSGGFNVQQIPVVLLDLKGNLISTFESIASLMRYFNKAPTYDTASINTSKVFNNKYRVVTPEFFTCNKVIIHSWKDYTCKAKERSRIHGLKRIRIYNNEEEYLFKTMRQVGNFLGITHQRVSQILKSKKGYHKASGYFVEKFMLPNCNNVIKK